MEVVGDGVFVDFADAALLCPQATGEVAKMVDGERNVGVECFADWLAVVDRLGVGKDFEVGFQAVSDSQQYIGAIGGGGATLLVGGGMGRVER